MIDYRVGDVRDRLADIPDGSVDLVTCSPPFLALRSYLPEGHESKHAEIGSEPTPAAFLSTLLGLTDEWRRILAPHGSIAIELGDTFSGSGGGGGDYLPGGWREGQQQFAGAAATMRESNAAHWRQKAAQRSEWPLAKSLCGLPTLYAWSLAYGRNLLDPTHTIAPWRVRNLIVWARPNPAVGALGDKFRPATSYITVACVSDRRWFDLDAVRTAATEPGRVFVQGQHKAALQPHRYGKVVEQNPAGAPPLDHWTDDPTDPDDGDLTWKLSTEGSSLAHYAMWPSTLAARLIDSMCPREVCRECGVARRRMVGKAEYVQTRNGARPATLDMREGKPAAAGVRNWSAMGAATGDNGVTRSAPTLGWSDCGHDNYRPGLVLDPFAGTGTSLAAAEVLGRDAIGIDLDHRNADLYPRRLAEVRRKLNPSAPRPIEGQASIFDELEASSSLFDDQPTNERSGNLMGSALPGASHTEKRLNHTRNPDRKGST